MHQRFCNLCDCRTEHLIRRGTFFLCERCTVKEAYAVAKDIAADPRATPAERRRARRRARVLAGRLTRLRATGDTP